MFGINDIIIKIMLSIPLTIDEKIEMLKRGMTNTKVLNYLADKFKNLTIEIVDRQVGSIIDLTTNNHLEGWCWQTTETAIMFLNEDDYIERGIMYLFDEDNIEYWHSWICFKFNNTEYVFDPCLNFLCEKRIYTHLFKTDVKGRVTAKQVRDELIFRISEKTSKEELTGSSRKASQLMEEYLGETLKKKRAETYIDGDNDITSPMFRNSTGYKVEFDDHNPPKIRKLIAHLYYGDC